MEKRHNIILITVILVSTLLTTDLVFLSSNKIKEKTPLIESFASGETTQISQRETQEEIVSPNGKMTLTVKNVRKTDVTTQTFFTLTDKDKTPVEIYSADSATGREILVPFNSFSPDNKYIFLKAGNSEKPEYIVLRSDGKNIKGEERTVEITGLFYEKHPEFVITDVTGWAGTGLVVFNTNYSDGKIGPSFWFDLSNFGFIRLSTKFN